MLSPSSLRGSNSAVIINDFGWHDGSLGNNGRKVWIVPVLRTVLVQIHIITHTFLGEEVILTQFHYGTVWGIICKIIPPPPGKTKSDGWA